ncbi:MAG: precorrin-6Y C5,15-methyltransferase (decarboxylating) subunit CbiT [Oscillospiraceae bacterium]|nr:precorrin-6Y C5,15-methyltransferase (decarboxylating) subunit CbiT [Oscillospiraceae bacterium]
MKEVTIISAGLGTDTLTAEAAAALERADVLFGAPRLLAPYEGKGRRCEPVYTAGEMAPVLEEYPSGSFAVLVSGDAGFYSAAERLRRELKDCQVRTVAGVSTVSAFAARLGRTWQDCALVSCHGRDGALTDTVRRNRHTVALTGGNVKELARSLCQAGFGDLTVHAAQSLGQPDEQVSHGTVRQLETADLPPLTTLWIENPAADRRVPFGIEDGAFSRGDVPMTKSAVRAVTMSRLAIRPDDVCWDVGCGTGSVTVELGLAAWQGHVYAVDKDESAAELTRRNAEAFHLGNVTVRRADAPEALSDLPAPDAVFIGGSGSKMAEIFAAVWEKNPCARIVVNAIALESAQRAVELFERRGIEPELMQLGVSTCRVAGGLHMMLAQNPVYIISGGGKE